MLAVAASVILAGLAAVLIAKRLETDHVIWTMVVGPAAAALAWAGSSSTAPTCSATPSG